ncbi:MAG TPA: N-acetyltransferase [Dongiaceae bacterium]|nr:N-acetyltransferase [Dongiaceae bacterium]
MSRPHAGRHADISLRLARPEDDRAIRDVIYAAFQNHPHHAPGATPSEHLIAGQLRDAGILTLSLVAERGREIVGHLAVSPVEISGGDADRPGPKQSDPSVPGWYGLGPVAVAPRCQNCGIGSAMVRHGVDVLHQQQAAGLVVLGEPHFYHRFGFRAENCLTLPGIPPAYFMALPICGTLATGIVKYHPAFG